MKDQPAEIGNDNWTHRQESGELVRNDTFDHMPEAVQMEAIREALVFYFETEDWLKERRKKRPGIQ